MIRGRTVLILAALVPMSIVEAQPARPAFDVASVKRRTRPNPTSVVAVATPGAFRRESTTVSALVQFAYDLLPFQLLGGPEWIRTERLEVDARMDPATTLDDTRLMVQSLLEERFGLKVRRESREMQGFALVRRDPGALGSLINPVSDCSENVEMPPDVPKNAVRSTGCSNMAFLARSVARRLSAPVVDRTGLTGTFAYRMFYAQEGARASGTAPDAPAFTTALQEQLGLKLEPVRGPFDVLVIESVQPLVEN